MNVIQRQWQKLSWFLHSIVGRDNFTGLRVVSRNDLYRFGSGYGGWTVPTSLLDSESICYLAGCGEDITFDLALIERFDCDVHGFDPTPRAIEHVRKVAAANSKYHFHPIGLWDEKATIRFYSPTNADHVSHSAVNLQKTQEYFEAEVDSLDQIMQRLGHERIDLLKIDIEGAEYKVIDSMLTRDIDVRVLCVEFDEYANPLDAAYRKRIISTVKKIMAAGYTLICAERSCNYTFVREH